jgi:hypothetical protein
MTKPLELSGEDLELIEEELTEALEVQKILLDEHIERDQMPETVEEFLDLVRHCTDRIAQLKGLLDRVKEASSG